MHDCCNPLFAHFVNDRESRAVVECIFAGGFEAQVPFPGPDSFTKNLSNELGMIQSQGQATSIVELHRRLICRLLNWQQSVRWNGSQLRTDEDGRFLTTEPCRVTPVHLSLSKGVRKIWLTPKGVRKGKAPMRKNEGDNHQGGDGWPKALLAVRIENDVENMSELEVWLKKAPQSMVKLVGILPSFSSLLLLAVSIPIWDLLPDSNAISFVGFMRDPDQDGVNIQKQVPTALETPMRIGSRVEPSLPDEQGSGMLLTLANAEGNPEIKQLLDHIDRVLPSLMIQWKELRSNSTIDASQWLFDRVRETCRSREAMDEHKVCDIYH